MIRDIGFLIFPRFQLLDAAGPIATFDIGSRYGRGAYRLHVLAARAGRIESTAGASLDAIALKDAPPLDTLVIAGGDGTRVAEIVAPLLDYVRGTAASARRVASVCTGAFILAEAGLLDGLRATTHWSRTRTFAQRYPRVRLEPDRIFIKEGSVWTSAGITAGIDLSLALIAEDLGEDVARLAARAAMSPRNFARAFVAETGVTPARAVERLRVEAARERVEAGAETIDEIAISSGFGDPERMRRAFVRAFGQPPQALRRAARG